MTNVLVNETSLQNIADSIRAKNGSSDTYTPAQMSGAIDNIPSGATIKCYKRNPDNPMWWKPSGGIQFPLISPTSSDTFLVSWEEFQAEMNKTIFLVMLFATRDPSDIDAPIQTVAFKTNYITILSPYADNNANNLTWTNFIGSATFDSTSGFQYKCINTVESGVNFVLLYSGTSGLLLQSQGSSSNKYYPIAIYLIQS